MLSEETGTVLAQPTAAAIRDELQRLVIADLHGPLGGETEEFGGEQPTDRYLLGRLAPDGTVIEPDDQDETPGHSIPIIRRRSCAAGPAGTTGTGWCRCSSSTRSRGRPACRTRRGW